jgi:hypothetical protein
MKHLKENDKINLQLFAEGETPADAPEVKPEAEETKQAPEKKYSDEEVDKIVKGKYAKWKADYEKDLEAAKEEAAKLAKMNADQKQQYEMDKLRAENEELKKAQMRAELGRTASDLLTEKNIEATQDILDFVVGEDAASTNKNIDKFVKIIEAQVKKAEVARATGTTPRNITNNGNTMSEIDRRIAKYQ